MATIVYKNAKCFFNDAQLDAQLNELSLEYKAEMLDATVFGLNTRTHKGGLYVTQMSAKGFFDSSGVANAIDSVLFTQAGLDEGDHTSGQPTIVTVFPNGIIEGTVTEMGFSTKGVLDGLTLGGAVGVLLPLSFIVYSRGIN